MTSKIKTIFKVKCLDDDFEKDMEIQVDSKIHFDVEHFNFILWESEDELYEKLKNRIEATII